MIGRQKSRSVRDERLMVVVRKLMLGCPLVGAFLWLIAASVWCQAQGAAPQASSTPPRAQAIASVGVIHGIVKSGNMPIPGAAISITAVNYSDAITTWTDVDGSYSARVPAYGTYTVRVQMVAFANGTEQVVVDRDHSSLQSDFLLTLLSRTHEQISQP